jgi:hypothetical protein
MSKIALRQSHLKHYFDCPKKFGLSLVYPIDESKDALREGCLFEGFLFGFKGDKDLDDLIGKKKDITIDRIKAHAEQVKAANFFSEDGEKFCKRSLEGDSYTLNGEYDYVGIMPSFGGDKFIADLKYTGDLIRIWESALENLNKKQFFQSVVYPYIEWRLTGQILPFIYIIVENKYDQAIIKTIKVTSTIADFMELEAMLTIIGNSSFLKANEFACVSNFGRSRCEYLEHCPVGRYQVGQPLEIYFSDLT